MNELLQETDSIKISESVEQKRELNELFTCEAAEPTLLNVPVEIFLKICSFLDADFIGTTLRKVCRRFESILADTELWKYWLLRRVGGIFPALPHLDTWASDHVWEQVCTHLDREHHKWTQAAHHLTHIAVSDVHLASVDAVLLLQGGQLCVSGGRDRELLLWRLSSLKAHRHDDGEGCQRARPEAVRADAHAGWVWDLAPDPLRPALYSGSFDKTVKAWDLEGFRHKQTFHCSLAVVSLATADNLLFAGLYSKKVLVFDVRAGPEPVQQYCAHTGPVLALQACAGWVASAGKDRTVALYDGTAGKLLPEAIRLASGRAYPSSMSWGPAGLYVGDSRGALHLLDPARPRPGPAMRVFPESSPAHKVTALQQSPGQVLACSDRGEIRFLFVSDPPREYASVKSDYCDLTSMQYQNGVLAVGNCHSSLEFWIPSKDVSAV